MVRAAQGEEAAWATGTAEAYLVDKGRAERPAAAEAAAAAEPECVRAGAGPAEPAGGTPPSGCGQ